MKRTLLHRYSKAFLAFCLFLALLLSHMASGQATVKRVLLQGFWWDYWNNNYPNSWANYLVELAPRLKSMGIDAVWIPPTAKANGGTGDVGYGPFDHYDLGDKLQKGNVRTRVGSKDELLRLIAVLHANGIEVIQDIVPNHTIGAGDVTPGGQDPAAQDDQFKLFRYVCYATPAQLQTAAEYRLREGRFPKNWQNFHPNPGHNCNSGDICQQLFGPDICFWDGATGQTTIPNTWDPNQVTYSPYGNGGTSNGNGYMRKHYREWLIWYKKQTGFDGVRMDAVKHFEDWVAEDFLFNLQFNAGFAGGGNAMFNVGEWVGSAGQLDAWTNAVQRRAGTFDFSLRDGIKQMIDNGLFNISTLPGFQQNQRVNFSDNTFYHITVPFVNNHDTFRPCFNANGNYIGWQDGANCAPTCLDNGICRDNELADHVDPFNPRMALGYAAMMAVDGQPQVFFEDLFNVGGTGKRWTHRPDNTTDLPARPYITNLIWCHQNLDFKSGAYKVRTAEQGVGWIGTANASDLLIIERSARAIIGINDRGDGQWQEAWVNSDFQAGTILKDYSGANGSDTRVVQGDQRVRINVPPVDAVNNRWGYAVWAPVGQDGDVYNPSRSVRTTQEWEMADDLGDSHCSSLGQGGHLPAGQVNFRVVGKVFVQNGTAVNYDVFRESAMAAQPIVIQFADLNGTVHHRQQGSGSLNGSFSPGFTGWLTIKVRNASTGNSRQKVWVKVDYQAPATVDVDLDMNKPETKVAIFTGNGGDQDWANCRNWEEGNIPDQNTDVVIPEGQILTLNGSSSVLRARNIWIQDGGSIQLASGKSIEVSGNWNNSSAITVAVCGTVVFKGTGTQTISGPNQFCTLEVDNAGKLLLQNSTVVTQTLSLKNGNVETGSNELQVANAAPASITGFQVNQNYVQGNLRRSVSGTQAYEFPVGYATHGLNRAVIAFTSVPSASSLLARFSPGTTQSTIPQTLSADVNNDGIQDQVMYNCVYGGWVITADNNSSNQYQLTLHPSTSMQNTCAAGQYPTIGKDGVYTANSGLTKSFTGFSTFDVVTAGSVILPVRFLQFNGQVRDAKAVLQWQVAEDGTQSRYVIEKSLDGANYTDAGSVQSQVGNGLRSYRWQDDHFTASAHYRLRAEHQTGTAKWSQSIFLRLNGSRLQVHVSPNPFVQQVQVRFTGIPTQERFDLQLSDRQGRQLISRKISIRDNVESIINTVLQRQASGVYLLRVRWNDEVHVHTLIKQ